MAPLDGTLPELQAAYASLAAIGAAHGYQLSVADYGGVRTQADTSAILNDRQADYAAALRAGAIKPDTTLQQFRPIAPYGSSYHNYGAAFDVLINGQVVQGNAAATAAAKYLAQFGPSLGLRWGGTFSNPDPAHFELAISLSDAQQRYQRMASSGGDASGPVDGTLQFTQGDLSTDLDVSADPFGDTSYLVDDGSGDASAPTMDPTTVALFAAGVLALLYALSRVR